MVCKFYNYIADMKFLIPALVIKTENAEVPQTAEPELTEEKEKLFRKDERQLKAALEQWVEGKKYCQSDVSVDDIVKDLGTDNYSFRYYFREVMKTDFRTWRAELRIAEAKKLMKENPAITLGQLASLTGLNHRANFHRQFQKVTGETPSDYKKRL